MRLSFRQTPKMPTEMADYHPVQYHAVRPFDSIDQYVRHLADAGMFAGLPQDAPALNIQAISEWKDIQPTDYHQHLYGFSVGDLECIYQEGDYRELLQGFCSHSYGVLQPEAVSEQWARSGESWLVNLKVTIAGSEYEHTWDYTGDYASPEFLRFVDALVMAHDPALGVKIYRQLMMMCNLEGFKEAVLRKLLPVSVYREALDQMSVS